MGGIPHTPGLTTNPLAREGWLDRRIARRYARVDITMVAMKLSPCNVHKETILGIDKGSVTSHMLDIGGMTACPPSQTRRLRQIGLENRNGRLRRYQSLRCKRDG